MQKSPFSLVTDGSNDNRMRIFDINLGKVKTSLPNMCIKGGAAEELFLV